MSPPRPVDMGSVTLRAAAAATAPSAALPPSRRTRTAASVAKRWLVAAMPGVTPPPCTPAQPSARGRDAAPAMDSPLQGRIPLLYARADGKRAGDGKKPPLS